MTAREIALKTLAAYRKNRTRPDAALSSLVKKHNVPQRDAALAAQITGGVIQNMALCDYYAACYSSIELKKIEPQVLDIIRLSIYQIVSLTRIPHNAAVNEGVSLVKKHANRAAAGFTNAILRKVANAAANGALPEITGCFPKRLSVKYSHPEWLVHELIEAVGAGNAEELLKKHNETDVPLTAQINTLLTDTGAVIESLEADGVRVSCPEWPGDCLELRGTGSVERLEAFRSGWIYIQDTAARLAVTAAGLKPHDVVIDACAAPGGKAFAAAITMNDTGRIVCFDISEEKLRMVTDGAARLGVKSISAAVRDAASPDPEFAGKADAVIADVPCSGFGVIRKKPEIRYKPQSEIAGLPDLQKKMISSLSVYVKPGGTLLYSTCTIFKRENEDVVMWFLDTHGDFYADAFSLPGVGDAPDGMVALWPHIHGTDGFFICKMKRKT